MRISDWNSDVCSSDLPFPAPVIDKGFDRHESFGVRVPAKFIVLADDDLPLDRARAILTLHAMRQHAAFVHGTQRAEHLHLLIAHCGRIDARRGFHGDKSEKLKQKVLDRKSTRLNYSH